jgi:glycosyltransferase involved in cell wall biosynthesis
MQSIVPMAFAKLFRLKYFFEVNDDPYRQLHHSGSLPVFKIKSYLAIKMDEVNLKNCDKAFIVTDEIKERILNKNPWLNSEKLITLNSGANTKLLKPLDKHVCCKKIGIDPYKNYVGFLGTIFKHSGLDILISCAKQILSHNSNVEFLIFGDGPQKSSLIEETQNRGLDQNFKFFGQVDYFDLPVFLGATDICVAPFLETSDTNSATKIFDYLACGKPVIASNIENKENIFAESKAVYFVKPGDPYMLADAIVHLLKDNNFANELGKKGRLFIDKNYSREKIARKIAKIADGTFSNLVN